MTGQPSGRNLPLSPGDSRGVGNTLSLTLVGYSHSSARAGPRMWLSARRGCALQIGPQWVIPGLDTPIYLSLLQAGSLSILIKGPLWWRWGSWGVGFPPNGDIQAESTGHSPPPHSHQPVFCGAECVHVGSAGCGDAAADGAKPSAHAAHADRHPVPHHVPPPGGLRHEHPGPTHHEAGNLPWPRAISHSGTNLRCLEGRIHLWSACPAQCSLITPSSWLQP